MPIDTGGSGGRRGRSRSRERRVGGGGSSSGGGRGGGGGSSGAGNWPKKTSWSSDWRQDKSAGGAGGAGTGENPETQDLMQEVGKMLEANGRKKEGWEEIEEMKAKFKLSESVELGLKILSNEHLKKLLGSSIQWRLAEVADKDKLVRSIIAKFDSHVDGLIQRLEDKDKEMGDKGSNGGRDARHRSREEGGGDRKASQWDRRNDPGGSKDDRGLGGPQGHSQQQGAVQNGQLGQQAQKGATPAALTGLAALQQQKGFPQGQLGRPGAMNVPMLGGPRPFGLAALQQSMLAKAGAATSPALAAAAARGGLPANHMLGQPHHNLHAPANALNTLRPLGGPQVLAGRSSLIPPTACAAPRVGPCGQPMMGQRPAVAGLAGGGAPSLAQATPTKPRGRPGASQALQAAGLSSFLGSLAQLGVERLEDFAYVTEADLKAMNMTIIQQRKFRELMTQAR